MPSISTSLLLLANRVLPPVDLPGDTDPLDYARWENETAAGLIEVYRSAGGPARRALDAGCGYGGKTTRLRELDPEVEWTALDISRDHLRHAGSWFEHSGHTPIHRTQADAARLPFADASFDRIVTADALEHLPEPEATLREFRRCLTPNGRIVLLFNPWSSPRGSHLGDLLALPWCQVLFSRESLVDATRAEASRRASRMDDPAEAQRCLDHGEALVEHFLQHVHPTRIADLRRWLVEQGQLEIESQRHFGPGPLRDAGFVSANWCEEFFSATYAAVLRPIAS
jgi:ubiquinone/menaquinone biosynthesis C-methylase UbiE